MNKEKPLIEKIDRTFKRYTAGYIPSKAMKFQEDVLKDVAQAVERYVETCFELQKQGKIIDYYVLRNEIFGDLK